MNDQSLILNKIIPADDLYFDSNDGRYVALSDEDIDLIIERCVDNNLIDQKSITHVVNWCTSVRVGQLLMKNFLAGKISIRTLSSDGEPFFGQSLPD